MSYQLISLDMDGTLLSSDLKISDENKKAIVQACLQGKDVVIATGRSLTEMTPYQEDLKDIRYMILENGAVIYDNLEKKMLAQHVFLTSDVEKIVKVSYRQDLMPQFFTGGHSYSFTEKMMHMDKYNMGKLQDLYLNNVQKIIDFDEFLEKYKSKMEKIIFFHQSLKEMALCHEYLKDINVTKTDVGISIEMSPLQVSKASALTELCDKLHISMEETMAVGDSDNDLEILKQVGKAIAMGNANENVKNVCDEIVAGNDFHGVAQAIHDFFLKDVA